MQLLDRIDQIARRAATFREAQDQIVCALRASLPHYEWVGLQWSDGQATSDGQRGTGARHTVPVSHGGQAIGGIHVDSDVFNATDRALLEAVAASLVGRWARDVHGPSLGMGTRSVADPFDQERGIHTLAVPIHSSSTFAFEDCAAMEEYLENQERGYIYTRYGNPTIRAAEQAVAAIEGAGDSALFASGMAAIATTLLALVKAGDEIVAPHSIYGGSYHLLHDLLPRWGIHVRFLDVEELARFVPAERTRVVYFEPVTNPLLRVVDVEAVVRAARTKAGVHVVVDNTIATPVFLRPLEKGVDLVIHSATKYLGGHSDLIAGVVSGSRELVDRVRVDGRYLGGNFNPRDAFLLSRGIKTLPLRVRRQAETALALARWLRMQPGVGKVWHPFLEDHPDHALAELMLPGGGCGLVTFDLSAGTAASRGLVDRLTLWRRAASLGGVESLVSLPVLASHWNVPEEGLKKAGISAGTVRLSCGVEDFEDLRADLEQALVAVSQPARV